VFNVIKVPYELSGVTFQLSNIFIMGAVFKVATYRLQQEIIHKLANP